MGWSKIIQWGIITLTASLWIGCGRTDVPTPAPTQPPQMITPTASPSPTSVPATATDFPTPVPTPMTISTPEQVVVPTAIFTAVPGVVVKLTVVSCLQTFCPPYVLEQDAANVAEQPGIIAVIALDEMHIRLVYDPQQLSLEEAIRTYENTTGQDAIETAKEDEL